MRKEELMIETKVNYEEAVGKYVPNVDIAAVEGIVKYLGIALRSKDASVVAATDPEELKRVREGFLKKKLALTQSDAELDAALHEVMARMKDVRQKDRVTVYYLLAEKFGKLDLFSKR